MILSYNSLSSLPNGTFVGINATGTNSGHLSIDLSHNFLRAYAGFTTESDIVAAIQREINCPGPDSCTVTWGPQD